MTYVIVSMDLMWLKTSICQHGNPVGGNLMNASKGYVPHIFGFDFILTLISQISLQHNM